MKALYQEIAQLVGAYHRCQQRSNTDWETRHELTVRKLVKENMPSGGGVDNGTHIYLGESTEEKIVFQADFHHMNENGFYDGWTSHKIIITPSLANGFNLRVTG